MFIFLLIIVIFFLIIYNFYKYFTLWKYIEKFPGPKAWPIIGNVHQLGLNSVEYLQSLTRFCHLYEYEPFRIWLGNRCYLILSKPEDVEVVLSSTTLIKKTDFYKYLLPWIGKGLLTSDGNKWHQNRKMLTPAFHFKILVEFLGSINEVSNRFIQQLKAKSKTEKIFNFQIMVHYSTLDIICETAMGVRINAMENHNSEIVQAFQDTCYCIQDRVFSVLHQSDFLYSLSKDYKKYMKAIKIINDFNQKVINARREILESDILNSNHITNDDDNDIKKPKKAFLDTLLTATIDGSPLDMKYINEEVSTFMFEGHDTTTSGITFATLVLSRHPEIQEKAFQEQKEIFGDDMKRDPTFQEVNNMKYLEMIIKESLRLYPSVPFIGRVTEENIKLNGKILPAGTGVLVFIMAMGYNEKYFKDPYKFDPDRFDITNRGHSHPYDYVPFSAGPRNCIGQKFAMLEMKTVLSKMIRNFEILPPDKKFCYEVGYSADTKITSQYVPQLASVLTLKSENGVYISLRDRNIE